MASLPSERVHCGLWTDHTKSALFGAVRTTTATNGNIIIALLSVLIAMAGSHLWDLIAFVCYWQALTTKRQRGYQHQIRILLRNITSPGAFVLESVKVAWAWQHLTWFMAVAKLAALICSVGFIAASICVSLVVEPSGIQVLARSSSCGWVSWRNYSTPHHQEYQQTVFTQAFDHLNACYNKTSASSRCNTFARQALPIRNTSHVACPFPGLCKNTAAIRLDTGLLDSNWHLGINTGPNRRVQMQRLLTCAPLDADPYFTEHPMPAEYSRLFLNREPMQFERQYRWALGPLLGDLAKYGTTIRGSNVTRAIANLPDLTPRARYALPPGQTIENWHSDTFSPITELTRDDADTQLVILQLNNLRFFAPNDDPVFSAHRPIIVVADTTRNSTMYTADNPASFIGCAEQLRFCFGGNHCTALAGSGSAYLEANSSAPSEVQRAILRSMFMLSPTLYTAMSARMLVTRNTNSFQLGIPSNHWEAEVTNWFQYGLAVLQTSITHIAAGPGIARLDFDNMTSGLVHDVPLDGCQRMGAPDGFSNISMFGLGLVVGLSGGIIGLNLILVPALKWLYRRGYINSHRIKLWILEGVLHTQKQLYEHAGYVQWRGLLDDVPIPEIEDGLPLLTPLRPDQHVLIARQGGGNAVDDEADHKVDNTPAAWFRRRSQVLSEPAMGVSREGRHGSTELRLMEVLSATEQRRASAPALR